MLHGPGKTEGTAGRAPPPEFRHPLSFCLRDWRRPLPTVRFAPSALKPLSFSRVTSAHSPDPVCGTPESVTPSVSRMAVFLGASSVLFDCDGHYTASGGHCQGKYGKIPRLLHPAQKRRSPPGEICGKGRRAGRAQVPRAVSFVGKSKGPGGVLFTISSFFSLYNVVYCTS